MTAGGLDPAPHVVAIGIDLCSVARMAAALQRTPRLIDRICRPDERAAWERLGADASATIAAQLFAAKEAVMKALGSGFDKVSFDLIELVDGTSTWPDGAQVRLHGRAAEIAQTCRIGELHVSVSHVNGTPQMALATVLATTAVDRASS